LSYSVQLDLFEGPLDLLLYLIRKEEIEITEISLSRITDQYLAYLETLQELELDGAGEYLLIAATLLKIKSRNLLPRQGEDEEADPQRDLVAQLLEYRKYKELAARFRDLAEERGRRHDFVPAQPLESLRSREEVFELEFFDLLGALKDVLGIVAEREARHRVTLEEVKLEEKLELLRERLATSGAFLFRDFFAEAPSRLHLVVTFIALLEMMRTGELTVRQEGAFAEIWIRSAAPDERALTQAASA
jgi:segregation and condensation protein A